MARGEGACGRGIDDGGKNAESVNVGEFLIVGSLWR